MDPPHQSRDPMHGVRRSLDGNVRFSQNPMRFSHSERDASVYDDPYKNARSPPSAPDRGGLWTPHWLMHLLPRSYFHFPYEHKSPVAPPRLALTFFVLELLTVATVFAAMCWYFRTTPTTKTTITLAPLPGQTCSVLNPRKDTTFYSADHSENAQFASPYMTSTECVSLLTRLDVCGDGRRLDHVTLWGVSNPNTTHYYSGGKGYLSFTPTQTPGLATQLVPFFQPSVSFPKPDISRPAFLGSDSNWYLFNFANNTAADAVTSFRGVPASTFLYDATTNIVYNPDPTTQQRDYDLSSSSPNENKLDLIRTIGMVTGGFEMSGLGVNEGVYYGLRGAAAFNEPSGVAVDRAGNVYVADFRNGLVRRIDATTQVVTNLGTSASPAFNYPAGVAVDADGNVFVTDSGNGLVRRIDAKTQAVTSLGISASPAFSSPRGVAMDAEGNVFVADSGNGLVRRIDAKTQVVTNLGTSASPAFSRPFGVAVDKAGNLFIADKDNCLVRRIDATTQVVTSLGTSASPAFFDPRSVAVDAFGNVFVADNGNGLVRMIDAATQDVTSLGTSASPPFRTPHGVAVDAEGNVFVGDFGNNLVRRIDAKTLAVTRYVGPARVLSWDIQNNPDPSSFTLWPDTALTDHNSFSISVVDTAAGGCQNVVVPVDNIYCFLLAHAEVSPADGRLYLELQQFVNNFYNQWTIVVILDPAEKSNPATTILISARYPTRQLWGVFNTPANGTVLFTSRGEATDTPDNDGCIQYPFGSTFESLVTADGTSIVDASAIPSKTPGEEAQFLLLTLREKGLNTMYTYDVFTSTVVSENKAAAATTHAMLAFTWGVCDGSVTRGLVELSFSNAYSNKCPLPKTGLYYQSPNVYYAIPYACLSIAYDKLLTDCPEIRANMKAIVDASCQASIAKVCRQQYDLNPPFSCVTDVYPSALTVISLSSANAQTVMTFLALVVAALLARAHRHYRPSEQDIAMVNTPSRNHANANAEETKSGSQSFSGPRQGIEMLPPHGASMQEMLGAHKRMEAENAQLRELVHSLSMTQQQQQHELKLLQQQQQPPMHHQQQYQQQLPPSASTTQNVRASLLLDVPPLPTSVPHLSSPSPYQVMPPFNMAPPIPPQRRPSQQQRPSWSAETASFDEGQRDGSGRL